MTPAQYERAKRIFLDLCDLDGAVQRSRATEMAGGDEVVLRYAIALLESESGASENGQPTGADIRVALEAFLEPSPAPSPLLPENVGKYRVIRRIGSGGMGDVFEASQESPRRRVAIKLMRAGVDSAVMLLRFRREIDFLGRLSHPGIARVYEAGSVRLGTVDVPYYAMELVDGLPLTQYAAANGLGVEDKLRMFVLICDAVQHAHQHGIIHRDLKPANILVQDHAAAPTAGSPTEEREVPPTRSHAPASQIATKGLPRILDFGIARAVEAGAQEGEGRPAPTIATEAGQIIGTVPYMSPEQMNGDTPGGGAEGGIDTRTDVYALGVILFELLTGKLPHATEGLPLIQAARLKAESAPLRLSEADHRLRGDLETIVSKALCADKKRRYASASELGADVLRFLNREVITARPATVGYQLTQFARRNRAVVLAAGAGVLVLIGGIAATSLQARAAIRERDKARQKTSVAEDVSSVLLNALTVATPKGGRGVEPTLLDTIDQIEIQARDPRSELSPEVKAVVLNIIGIVWRDRGNLERAERDLSESLAIRRKVLTPGDPNLADSLNNMGILRRKQGRHAEGAAFHQEAVDLQLASSFPDEKRLARNIHNLASTYITAGDLAKAKPLLEKSLAMHIKLFGAEHELVAINLLSESRLAGAEEHWSEALDWNTRALDMFRKTLGPVNAWAATTMHERSNILTKLKDSAAAIEASIGADAMAHSLFAVDPPHPTLKSIREQLVKVLREGGRMDDAGRMEADLAATMTPAPPASPQGSH